MKLTMNLSSRSYDIIIKSGVLSRMGQLCDLQRKVLIVTDDGVPAQYADTVAMQCKTPIIARVPQGEGSKSLATFEHLCAMLLEHKFTRGDLVVAVGGGVMGDLAGFVASSYMRGIDFINCPTTTLAQIDSSIGGKVAVNLNGTKNILGAFYQPRLVLIDPDTLQTLSPRLVSAGLAEAVKAGLIMDPDLFALFETEDPSAHFEEILYRSLQMKQTVVQQDEHDYGVRTILNFGHTIGHAIESYGHLGELYHGECVALGMIPMVEDKALLERLLAVYRKLNLPTTIAYDGDAIYDMMTHDKKATTTSDITVVKVPSLGTYRLDKIPMTQLRTVIGEGI